MDSHELHVLGILWDHGAPNVVGYDILFVWIHGHANIQPANSTEQNGLLIPKCQECVVLCFFFFWDESAVARNLGGAVGCRDRECDKPHQL